MQQSMSTGYLAFGLHSHVPYVRRAGRWPHGEEMWHEVLAEAYVPLLNVFYNLRAEAVPFRLTIGITPILAEQLADADVLDHFEASLLERLQLPEHGLPGLCCPVRRGGLMAPRDRDKRELAVTIGTGR